MSAFFIENTTTRISLGFVSLLRGLRWRVVNLSLNCPLNTKSCIFLRPCKWTTYTYRYYTETNKGCYRSRFKNFDNLIVPIYNNSTVGRKAAWKHYGCGLLLFTTQTAFSHLKLHNNAYLPCSKSRLSHILHFLCLANQIQQVFSKV